ncbi:glucuronate isomerase [Halopiger xanaduensis]|uniref:Uronate isomerase n=1 Tax=Halopiger xanaduensis (strain DSM 18323 / JCM 14033 / SH-6) TaxID=797210 RepID=F8DCC6_HALXS|nr:glucuronate isomerase [Halopiger xanaduensis]AEH38383.1 Uronate isomerase [Halopiger xanaduensis SH-6]
MSFLDEDYLLETAAARELYDAIADLPIVDPHTHADVAEIVENDGWDDIWEVEAATDHYVWALMRNCGVDEELITGDADNREKWTALAEVFPQFAGNPTYEWVHLDLKRRFGIEKPISAETADEIWEETKTQLAADDMRPQELLAEMNVEVVGSTDDPTDDLEYHERAVEEVEGVDIVPTWRADRAVKIERPEWTDFVAELEAATELGTDDFDGFLAALEASHDYFAERGCRACDLGIEQPVSRPVSDERAREIYQRGIAGGSLSEREVEDFQAYLTEYIGELNAAKGWVTQLHIGPVRNYRDSLFERLGPAAGGDISTQDVDLAKPLEHFLNRFDDEMNIVCYTIDPTHYPTIATIARVFPNVTVGPAWWFNDSPFGIEGQLEYVGTVELLSQHAGMVSDSRKLLSYGSRFEMFRRSLANVVGNQVDRGQVPTDVAHDLVERLAYDRPKELYGF